MKKRATISDVARYVGVSAQTVSRAINDKGEIRPETRQRILDAVEELDYRPSSVARSLATRRTQTLGLIVPDIANPFFSGIVRGIEDIAWQGGYGVILCNSVEDIRRERAAVRTLDGKMVDGIIMCSPRLGDDELFTLLRPFRAAVFVNRPAPDESTGVVMVDDFEGARLAVQHLLDGGRRNIAFLTGPQASYSARRREAGFQKALEQGGLAPNPALQIPCNPTPTGGYQAATTLLTQNKTIDALVCYDDTVAAGALQALAKLNINVPQKIAVIGYDDAPLAALVTPALTTLHVPLYSIGRDAATMLLNRMENKPTQNKLVHQPELIIRSTTVTSSP